MRKKTTGQVGRARTAGRSNPFAGPLLALALVGGAASTGAQGVDCPALRAEIDAGTSDPARSGQFASALRQQQSELDRLRDYADSIGCNSGFFFGGPPQCEGLSARVDQMQENVSQLQQQLQGSEVDSGWRRRALTEQYNSFCSPGPAGGVARPAEGPQLLPIDPDAPSPEDQAPAGAGPSAPPPQSKALCVRHCDGGFFPITDQATPDKLEGLGQLCKALCPNAEASLYTSAPAGGIETAVAADGTPYTALPTAFKYQKTYDATCSCKPPHQSWVQALADAEKLLEADKHDVTVTPQMSEVMSRPAPISSATAAKSAKKVKPARKAKPQPAAPIPMPNVAVDEPGSSAAENPGEDIMRQLRRGAPTP